MIYHPMALTITLLIVAEQRHHTCFEFAIYEVLNQYMAIKGWSDEKKSDLYANMAERIVSNMSLATMEAAVHECLLRTEGRFNG
jgi:hypothetical protein